MNKKIVLFVSIILSSSALSLTLEERALQEKENMKMLDKIGMTLPDSGIHVVPRSELNLSKEVMAQGNKEDKEMNEKGYVSRDSKLAKELLEFNRTVNKGRRLLSNEDLDEQSTDLRPNVSSIKLGFKFKGIEESQTTGSHGRRLLSFAAENDLELIAAAPTGGFHDERGGWSGVVQYFNAPSIGNCSYNIRNVKTSHTAARLAKEGVTYIINNKPTTQRVEGSDKSGFLYSIDWYDPKNFHELECATENYSGDTLEKVIELARTIDK